MNDAPLRVLVVDDTILYRRILTDTLDAMDGVKVVGSAPQGRLALARLAQEPVDLVLMDVEMPEMDGLEALSHIRAEHPETSVVMISGATTLAANATILALERGALDFIRKPEGKTADESRAELTEALRPLIRHVRTRRNLRGAAPLAAPPAPRPEPPARVHAAAAPETFEVVGIGISTGGPNALGELLPALPASFPLPILLVQHMPPGFTASLAEHLAKRCKVKVKEAKDGEALTPGCVHIAPGGHHMVVRQRTGEDGEVLRFLGLNQNPPEHSCRPSVDVLFRSMAASFGGGVLAVVMTGMGSDGCEGVRALKRKGCYCITQTEESCVVYGMPQAVDEAGLSDERVGLSNLAGRLSALAARGR